MNLKKPVPIGIILAIILAIVALIVWNSSAGATEAHVLNVDGVEFTHTADNGGTIHWDTPTPNPKSASYGDVSWQGNGASHLDECDLGVKSVHWVFTKNSGKLVLSHVECECLPEETTTTVEETTTTVPETTTTVIKTTTTTTTVPETTTTTTTVPETTTTVEETTTTVEDSTTTSTPIEDTTTTSVLGYVPLPIVNIGTAPPTTTIVDIATPPVKPTVAPAPDVPELPQTGVNRNVVLIALLILLIGSLLVVIARRRKSNLVHN